MYFDLRHVSKKWNPNVRADYEALFSIDNWKRLPANDKKERSLSPCIACSINHIQLQEAFPGKPVFYSKTSISLSLPETPKAEKLEVRKVLGDLNKQWDDCHGHSYSSVLAKLAPEANLTKKKTKLEQKQQNRNSKRKFVNHINQQLSENATLTVLAEAESMQAYRRKRNAMSFETPTAPSKKIKLHSTSADKHTWNHEDATTLLSSHPPEQTINWSRCARRLHIPGGNAGQTLKEYAEKQGFDVITMEQKNSPPPTRIRRKKKKLPGGEISTPSLPTQAAITAEKKDLIACGKLSIREPCSPYTVTKSVVTAEGEVITKEVEVVGRKLSLEVRQKLLHQHSNYMRLMTDQEIKELTREKILQLMSIAHYHASPTMTIDELHWQYGMIIRLCCDKGIFCLQCGWFMTQVFTLRSMSTEQHTKVVQQ